MADERYLRRRGHTWFFAIAVPRDLRGTFGKDRIVISLKTGDLREAQDLRWARLAEINERFRRARASEDPLSPARVAAFAVEIHQATLEQLEAHAQQGKHPQAAPEGEHDERSPEVAGLDLAVTQIEQALEDGDFDSVEQEITAYERRNGVEYELGLRRWSVLGEAILKARHAAYVGRSRALRGEPSEPFGLPAPVDPVTLQRRQTPRQSGKLAFADVAKRFIAEKQRDPAFALTEQTRGQYEAAYRIFDSFARQPALDQVDRSKASEFLDKIATLNPRWGRGPGIRKLSFTEIIARFGNHTPGLSNKTINRYAMALGMVWKYAEDRDAYEGRNPWTGQMRPTTKRRGNSETDKRAFTSAEIATLLMCGPDASRVVDDAQAMLPWLALIGAYSGMRLNEICELDVADVKEIGGILFFDLTKAKTEAGLRVVPVHSAILAAGFRDYIKFVHKGALWPGLKAGGPDNKRSWYASKAFTTYRRGFDLVEIDKVTGRDRLDFHSLRRSAITALKNAGIAEHDAAEVVGHDHPRVTFGVYPDRHRLARLQQIVEAIRYPLEDQ
ncbi:site-specific integrase [Hyphomicrobium sulfonivorans]|uniref:site-specific integrase n=1 Tax=Hyphomicrobium sulfonivorans TaxID=121290 RepID=UPI00156E87A3|nr:site-specific integrase [Hyphomicrobium sulfonivorans]MBI1651165.1 site-specific integrase [Hyphomicrobium sulfonivorans]NSL72451.1 hypothetical protein [Hyphomicrobium sulfonivorans]